MIDRARLLLRSVQHIWAPRSRSAVLVAAGLVLASGGYSPSASPDATSGPERRTAPVYCLLGSGAIGVSERVDNCTNLTVVADDRNVLKAEYEAGFIQGHLQGVSIGQARDNFWFGCFEDAPPANYLAASNTLLNQNLAAFVGYLRSHPGTPATLGLTRQLFRMLGIYHGATLAEPKHLDFSGEWLPDSSYFTAAELQTNYGTPGLTFLDVYFVNAWEDLSSVFATMPQLWQQPTTEQRAIRPWPFSRRLPQHCSAFVKRTHGDILMAHTSWASYWAESMTMTLQINHDRVTMNTLSPGQLGSMTDFGFNNKGLMFNETTSGGMNEPVKVDGVFIFWRAAVAEELSGSLDDFFKYISLDNTGTYLNTSMLVDSNTKEIGLVDMSSSHFVFFRSSGGPYTITTLPEGGSTDYDPTMVDPDYILGYNYPPSMQCRNDLQPGDNSTPDRTTQLDEQVPALTNVAEAKATITFFDPLYVDSVMSRYDLDIASNPYGPGPFGAIDAKVGTASMAQSFKHLSGTFDPWGGTPGFWMKFGTARYNGEPFIWSASPWASLPHPGVPDRLDGSFAQVNYHLR